MFLLYITEMLKYIDAFIINNWNHWRSIHSQIYTFSVESYKTERIIEQVWNKLFAQNTSFFDFKTWGILFKYLSELIWSNFNYNLTW